MILWHKSRSPSLTCIYPAIFYECYVNLHCQFAFIVSRACAEAWAAGGLEGERQERELWETRERRKVQESLDAMTAIKENALKRQQAPELSEKGKNTFCF